MQRPETMYFQCNLMREVNGQVSIQNSYLPEKFANTGQYVKLKNSHDEWEDHWQVIGGRMPGEKGRTFKDINERSRDHKKTRAASDI